MDAQKGGKLCYCQRFDFVRIKPKEERFHFVPESEFIVSLLVPDIAEYNSDFLKMKTGDHDVNSCETSFFYVGLWLIEVCYKMFLQLTSLGLHIGKMIIFAEIDRVIHEEDKMFSFNFAQFESSFWKFDDSEVGDGAGRSKLTTWNWWKYRFAFVGQLLIHATAPHYQLY